MTSYPRLQALNTDNPVTGTVFLFKIGTVHALAKLALNKGARKAFEGKFDA